MLCDEVRGALHFVHGQERLGNEHDRQSGADEAERLASENDQEKRELRSRDKTVEIKKKSLKQVSQSKEPEQVNGLETGGEDIEKPVMAPMPPAKSSGSKNDQKWADLDKDIDDSDFEMPEDAVQCRMKKITKIKGNKRVKTVRRIFKMKNGTEEVHEDVIVEKI